MVNITCPACIEKSSRDTLHWEIGQKTSASVLFRYTLPANFVEFSAHAVEKLELMTERHNSRIHLVLENLSVQ